MDQSTADAVQPRPQALSDIQTSRTLGPSDNHDEFLNEWRRFQRAQERRRAYFLCENQQIVKTTSRLFIISHNEDPWHCFGLTSRIDYCRRVFELSGLHFSELHDACASGDCDRIQEILESDDGDDSQGCTLSRDCSGRIPLHHAVSREHHRAIQLLLAQKDRRLQLHVRDNRGATPVQCVLEKMRCLALNLGFKPAERAKQLRETNPRYRTLWRLADEMLASMNASFVEEIRAVDCLVREDVWDAVRFGDVERLKQIRTLYGDFGDVRLDGLGTTLLHEACCVSPRDLNVVLYLISELRVDRHVADQSGCTTLHLAAMRGWLEACVLLLTDIEDDGLGGTTEQFLLATDARGRTPLHAALGFAGRGRRANDDLSGDTAAEAVATARYLLQLCPDALHVIDSDGFTPFHYAICTGDVQLVQLMIDLGADVLGALEQGVVPPTSVYGQKATWAPCGSLFPPHGETMGCSQVLALDPSKEEASSELTVAPPSNQANHLEDVEPFGCRRFGAVCQSCARTPDESTDQERPTQIGGHLSPLRAAIRSCHGSQGTSASRVAIIETILRTGASLDQAIFEETVRASISPQVLQPLLRCSSGLITADLLVRTFCGGSEVPHGRESAESTLLTILDATELGDLHQVIPSLFRYKCLSAVEKILARTASAGTELDSIIRSMEEPLYTQTTLTAQPKLSFDHLHWITRATEIWPDDSSHFRGLAIKCVSYMLASTEPEGFWSRCASDTAIGSAIKELFAITSSADLVQVVVEWTAVAIERGYMVTVKLLWPLIVAEQKLAVKLVRRLTWPVRSADADFVRRFRELAPSLVSAVLRNEDTSDESHRRLLCQCLVLASAFRVRHTIVRQILSQISHADCFEQAVELLVSQQFEGNFVSYEIVNRDDVELAEMLWTEVEITLRTRDRLWQALAVAQSRFLTAKKLRYERWEKLLYFTPPIVAEHPDAAMRVLQPETPQTTEKEVTTSPSIEAETNRSKKCLDGVIAHTKDSARDADELDDETPTENTACRSDGDNQLH